MVETFFGFARIEQQRKAEEMIGAESLNVEAAKRFMSPLLAREYASDTGTELNSISQIVVARQNCGRFGTVDALAEQRAWPEGV